MSRELDARAFVVAEMNTANFIFKGAGSDRTAARAALLRAWAAHRERLLALFPERRAILPEAEAMEKHFPIHYFDFVADAGYRDRERLT